MQKISYLPLAALIAFSATSWSDNRVEEAFIPSGSTPQLSISGSLQQTRDYAGQAHALIPVWDSEEAGISGYGYLTGQVSAQDWFVGAGGGMRATLENQLTIGGYGLVEHQRSEHGHRFWRFSPGLELQGSRWHLSANAYIPLGQKSYPVNLSLASIDYTTLEFSGFEKHTGFLKTPISTTERRETGIKGVDLVGSWQISDPITLSLGGYYLPSASETQSRMGIVAGIAYQLNAFLLEIQGHQDQAERQLQARVSWHLGNTPASSTSGRRLKPLQRPGADWAKPALQSYEIDRVEKLENLYFFKQGDPDSLRTADSDICTAEAPCGVISQDLMDQMPRHAILLLAEGGTFDTGRYLRLNNSQSILGRSVDFTKPADLTKRPTIENNISIGVTNASDVVLSRIQIQGGGDTVDNVLGLTINNSKGVLVDHVKLNFWGRSLRDFGIYGGSDVTIRNSESTALIANGNYYSYNYLYVYSGCNIVFEDNTCSASVTNADAVIGMISNNAKEFSASRNKFTIKSDKALIAMANIDGQDRKAEQNEFILTTANDKTVTTNAGGLHSAELLQGMQISDPWGNTFKREPASTAQTTSWLGSLFSR